MLLSTFDLSYFQASRGTARQMLCNQLDQICIETVFLLLKGHSVSSEIIAAQWKVFDSLFELSIDKKQEVAVLSARYPYGWGASSQETHVVSKGEQNPPDLQESFNGGPLSILA